ncbi:hypothetical protein FVF58_09690 [Paraburkholderia panacisoli]|uniref:Uncharacterized protein n=1 Tax=Paraburkholderia panacisoli TaxID=2603818 RepID=A0A5B0HD54_9BURK|nr:hypothetical protein [Paraburkholderia panacisoli]KAA1013052.1 hypothetical protein FVF58_09690 [Paraburkholderia panacisoli]
MLDTQYKINKKIDNEYRGQSNAFPATRYAGLIVASAGQSPRSTAVALNAYTVPAALNGRMYKCTTAGTTGSGEPAWPTTAGGTVTDGTAVWTEQTTALQAGTIPEGSATGYARVAITSSLANWAGTQGAGTTVASTGTSGQISNNNAIAFAQVTTSLGLVVGVGMWDASTSGNCWEFAIQSSGTPTNITANISPNVAAGALVIGYSLNGQ